MSKVKTIRIKLTITATVLILSVLILCVLIMEKLKSIAILLLVLLLIASVLILRSIIQRLVNPIEKIQGALKSVGQGNLNHRLEIPAKNDFSFLATQFNGMCENLEHTVNELENTRKHLENQINERTKTLNITNIKLQKAMEELKNTQKQIIQSEKQKSLTAIVSGFAHEINNPLTGILGYIDLMELRDDVSPYVKNKLSEIKTQSTRIKDIISELNQLNPESNQAKLEINLSNLLDKLIKIMSTKKENHHIFFEKEFNDDSITIYGNHFSLWQVFEGVIENSIEAIHERKIDPGRIAIKLRRSIDNARAITEIIDNGGGFENIDKAFDPFYTTKDRTKKKGIGLSISYNLIQEHRGNISISNHENGAMAIISLPLAKPETI